jgi:hypothetical protein
MMYHKRVAVTLRFVRLPVVTRFCEATNCAAEIHSVTQNVTPRTI